jgi:hypothetical protein
MIRRLVSLTGSTSAFAGTDAAADWVFFNTALVGRVCPRPPVSGPVPIVGLEIDPASLPSLSITIEAGGS